VKSREHLDYLYKKLHLAERDVKQLKTISNFDSEAGSSIHDCDLKWAMHHVESLNRVIDSYLGWLKG